MEHQRHGSSRNGLGTSHLITLSSPALMTVFSCGPRPQMMDLIVPSCAWVPLADLNSCGSAVGLAKSNKRSFFSCPPVMILLPWKSIAVARTM